MKKTNNISPKNKNKKQPSKKALSIITVVLLLFGLMVTMFAARQKSQEDTLAATNFVGLHAQGNQIFTQSGQKIHLRGVSTSGTENGCVQGGGALGGNPANQQEITTMKSWNINVVRVPLNEDCWLGINGANPGGNAYQSAIESYVKLLTSNGIAAILDLHWSAPGGTLAKSQQNMADSDHSPAFWTSVANTFKNNGSVIFELYNEPHDISWSCWKSGCNGYAGMQTMLNAVRATGATNLVIMGGLAWSDDLTGWLANKPTDPLNNIGAAWHAYNFNACNNQSCWTNQVQPVANTVPLMGTEIGETDCGGGFVKNVLNWLTSINQNFTAWAWVPDGCGFPSLLTNWNGTPSAEGQSVKDILAGSAIQPVPAATGTVVVKPTSTPTLTPRPTAIPMPTQKSAALTPGISPTARVTSSPSNTPIVSPTVSPTVSAAPSLNPDFPTPTTGPLTADMQIAVSVKIFGIGQDGNPSPKHGTRKITASIFDVFNQPVTTGTGFLNYDGSSYFTGTIHLGKMSQGSYYVKLVGDNTLQVLAKPEFQNLKVNQVNTIPTVTLYQGDMNSDNILDINDYNLVLPCFQSIPVCANVSQIDFNDDGVTDVKDYNLFLNSFEMLHGN